MATRKRATKRTPSAKRAKVKRTTKRAKVRFLGAFAPRNRIQRSTKRTPKKLSKKLSIITGAGELVAGDAQVSGEGLVLQSVGGRPLSASHLAAHLAIALEEHYGVPLKQAAERAVEVVAGPSGGHRDTVTGEVCRPNDPIIKKWRKAGHKVERLPPTPNPPKLSAASVRVLAINIRKRGETFEISEKKLVKLALDGMQVSYRLKPK